MKKNTIRSLAVSVLLFLALLLLWPVSYTHATEAKEQVCPPPGAKPGSIYNCLEQTSSGYISVAVRVKRPLLLAAAHSEQNIQIDNFRKLMVINLTIGLLGGLLTYEFLDKSKSRHSNKKTSKKKL